MSTTLTEVRCALEGVQNMQRRRPDGIAVAFITPGPDSNESKSNEVQGKGQQGHFLPAASRTPSFLQATGGSGGSYRRFWRVWPTDSAGGEAALVPATKPLV